MDKETQKVALPAVLRKHLRSFRVGKGEDQRYLIFDRNKDQTDQLEPWQFFVLEVLHGCEDFEKLSSVFEDRFGHPLKREELEALFSLIADKQFFGLPAEQNPIVAEFFKQRNSQLRETPSESDKNPNNPSSTNSVSTSKELPDDAKEALGLEDAFNKKGWKLFNPTPGIKIIQPLLRPLRNIIFILPVLFIAALFISYQHSDLIKQDLIRLSGSISFIQHAVISMLTVNLIVTATNALVAYTYRATVSAFCIVFYFGFFPRFMVRLGNARQLSRRERIWLNAAPLLARITLSSIGVIGWLNTRHTEGFIPDIFLVVATAGIVSFILTINPLVKSSGYRLIATLLNEPMLRGKSYKALINKFRGNAYQMADENALAAYGLTSLLFMFLIFTAVIYLLGGFLKIHLGGSGVIITIIFVVIFVSRIITKFKKVIALYERSVRFERWRERTLPDIEKQLENEESQKDFSSTFVRRALFLSLLVFLFIPYKYEPGGNFVVLPNQQQEVTSQLSGIINEINVNGGEFLKKGTKIGELIYSDHLSQVNIYSLKMEEQQSVIDELKSRPSPEEVELAESMLEVVKTQSKFSTAKLERLEKLYQEKTISFEDLDDARRESEVSIERVKEKQANLELIKRGVAPEQIAAAEAQLEVYKERRNLYQQKIDQSMFHMPFDGKIATLHLKQKIGSFIEKGEPLTVVENSSKVIVEIEVPESEISYLQKSAEIKARAYAFHDHPFEGIVTEIDPKITEKKSGRFIKVITLIDNQDGKLQAGMTGYAKISSQSMPPWRIITLAFLRFFKVEVWSWLP